LRISVAGCPVQPNVRDARPQCSPRATTAMPSSTSRALVAASGIVLAIVASDIYGAYASTATETAPSETFRAMSRGAGKVVVGFCTS